MRRKKWKNKSIFGNVYLFIAFEGVVVHQTIKNEIIGLLVNNELERK